MPRAEGRQHSTDVDVLVVVDIGDVRRLGTLTDAVRALDRAEARDRPSRAGEEPPGQVIVSDTTCVCDWRVIFDVAVTAGWPLSCSIATAFYTALLSDTGGFRFSNTSPRCHAIAGYLLSLGVDPEEMYRRVYASQPLGRIQLLRDALETLEVDPRYAIAWISVPAGAVEHYGLRSEDLDGIVEHPRSIAGTRLAVFFRDLGHGKVKMSFRSTGGRRRESVRPSVWRWRARQGCGGADRRRAGRGPGGRHCSRA